MFLRAGSALAAASRMPALKSVPMSTVTRGLSGPSLRVLSLGRWAHKAPVGSRRSDLWRGMLASVLGMPIGFPRGHEGSAFGAALSAWKRSASSRASRSRPTSCGSRRWSSRERTTPRLRAGPCRLRRPVRGARARFRALRSSPITRRRRPRQRGSTDDGFPLLSVGASWRGIPLAAVSIVGLDHVQVAAPPGAKPTPGGSWRGAGLPELPKPAALATAAASGSRRLRASAARRLTEDFAPARKAHPALVVSGRHARDPGRRLLVAGVRACVGLRRSRSRSAATPRTRGVTAWSCSPVRTRRPA